MQQPNATDMQHVIRENIQAQRQAQGQGLPNQPQANILPIPGNILQSPIPNQALLLSLTFGALAKKFGTEGVLRVTPDMRQGIIPNAISIVEEGADLVITFRDVPDFMKLQAALHKTQADFFEQKVKEAQTAGAEAHVIIEAKEPAPAEA